MTQKELYVFNTLTKWYKMEWRPDGHDHYLEMYGWAAKLVDREATEKNRPILQSTFAAIPVLDKIEVNYMANPNDLSKRGAAVRLFAVLTGGVALGGAAAKLPCT